MYLEKVDLALSEYVQKVRNGVAEIETDIEYKSWVLKTFELDTLDIDEINALLHSMIDYFKKARETEKLLHPERFEIVITHPQRIVSETRPIESSFCDGILMSWIEIFDDELKKRGYNRKEVEVFAP